MMSARRFLFITLLLLPSLAWSGDVFDEIAGPEETPAVNAKGEVNSVVQQPQLSYTYRLVRKVQALRTEKEYLNMYVELSGPEGDKIPLDDKRLLLAYLAQKSGMKWVASYWLHQTPVHTQVDIDALNLWRPNLDMSVLRLSTDNNTQTLGELLMDVSGIKLTQRNTDFYQERWLDFLNKVSNDKVRSGIQILRAHFLKKGSDGANVISSDELNINIARALYQAGYLDDAIKYYSKIKKSSPMWAIAVEEMAWADVRANRIAKAIARTKTLTNPFLTAYVHPEAYYLAAISSLKICNYSEVTNIISSYRKVFRPRYKNLQSYLAKIESLSAAKTYAAIRELKGSNKINLNLSVVSDELATIGTIRSDVSRITAAHKAAAKTSLQDYSAVRGYLAKNAETLLDGLRGKVISSLQGEIQDIVKITRTMHVVEAEMLQQVIERKSFTKVKSKIEKVESRQEDKWALVFPNEENDNWFDELDSYQVSTASLCLSQIKGGGNEKITQ